MPPLGRDWRSLYRSNFEWANLLARSGFEVLRFEVRGEGDSCEVAPEANQWHAWLCGVIEVATFARATTGAQSLCLAGFRMGGLLAACAAEAAGAEYLLLLAPYARGAVWLRELQLEAAIRGGGIGSDGQYNGIRLSSVSEQTIQNVAVETLPPLLKGAFVAAPDHKWWLATFRKGALHTQAFPGWSTLFTDSHVSEPPTEVLRSATNWLRGQIDTTEPKESAFTARGAEVCLHGDGWLETPLVFGDHLYGILTAPRAPHSATIVVFGNTAADPRSGASGSCATIARELAKLGVAAFRFDFSGVGESRDRRDGRPHVYDTSRVDEFGEAAAVLSQHGYDECIPAGICSGGFHAVDAVLSDRRFKGAVTFNSWLVWYPGPLDIEAQAYAMRSDQMRLHGSRKSVAHLYRRLAGRLAAMRKIIRSWQPNDRRRAFHRRLRAGAARGVRLHLVFGRRDRALDGLWSDFGPMGWAFRRHQGFSVRVRDGLDHSPACAKPRDRGRRDPRFPSRPRFSPGAPTARTATDQGGIEMTGGPRTKGGTSRCKLSRGGRVSIDASWFGQGHLRQGS
ncbi:hypothetical protein ACRAWG_34530 [Methylobacterium sp. P31]